MKNYISPFVQWLCSFFLFFGVMLAARMMYAGNIRYLFLAWNLFLAFVPYIISLGFSKMQKKSRFLGYLLLLCWLLFFPNALYIITDIIHLAKTTSVPLWYDAILLFSSAVLGLIMAFASLINIERYLCNYFKKIQVNLIVFLLIFAGSYGVYLGRFQRWNSWDILQNFTELMFYVVNTFVHPFEHTKMWIATLVLTGLYSIFWHLIKKFSQNLLLIDGTGSSVKNIV